MGAGEGGALSDRQSGIRGSTGLRRSCTETKKAGSQPSSRRKRQRGNVRRVVRSTPLGRSVRGDDPALLENNLDDSVGVRSLEDRLELLLARAGEDALRALAGVEDVERVDDLHKGYSVVASDVLLGGCKGESVKGSMKRGWVYIAPLPPANPSVPH